MSLCLHGFLCCKVNDSYRLTEWDVLTAVCHRFFYREVVKLCIATVLPLMIEGKECVARALEEDELIGQWHLAT